MIDHLYAQLMRSPLWEWLPQLLQGAWDTLCMTLIAFVLSLLLGLILALGNLSRVRAIKLASQCYIELFRGTPLLAQLFILYYGLSTIGINFSAYTAAILGLTLNSGAYIAELYRAGVLAIDPGQREAAQAIGMTRTQAMRIVILPQALRVAVPNLANYGVIILKSTSIASILSAPDLMMQAHDISSEYFMPMNVYLLTAAFYIAMAYPLSRAAARLETRLSYGY